MKKPYPDSRRRNKLLEAMLVKLRPKCAYITGEPDKPVIACKETDSIHTLVLSCYVSGFELHLLDAPAGKIVHTITISGKQVDKAMIDMFNKWKEETEHRQVFTLKHLHAELWLSGWNYEDRLNKEDRFPVFSKEKPLIFWEKGIADEVAHKYHLVVN